MGTKQPKTYNACAQPAEHRDHMCNLMEKGLTAEIQKRTMRPAYFCGNCSARADSAEDLCNPEKE